VTLRPSLDVNGLWGGHTGSGLKTIIPCEASAKITARVVEGQDASEVIQAVLRHMQARCPPGCRLDVVAVSEGSPASTIPADHPLVCAAEAVLRRESGREAIHVRLGATVPVTSLFMETLGIATLMFGYNLPDEDVHAPNEFFRLKSMRDGARAWALLLGELGDYSPASFASR
jgi:acetylornithine deacetylase/succinyl-diaminopimelate desuccinylase-like protein